MVKSWQPSIRAAYSRSAGIALKNPERINMVEGIPIAVKIKITDKKLSISPSFLIIINSGMMAALSGSMIPLKKTIYSSVFPLNTYRLIAYDAIEPNSNTKTIEKAVTMTLLIKNVLNPISTQTRLYDEKSGLVGRANGCWRISRVGFNDDITILKSGYAIKIT